MAVPERGPESAVMDGETATGNVMQFGLHYGEGNEDILKKFLFSRIIISHLSSFKVFNHIAVSFILNFTF